MAGPSARVKTIRPTDRHRYRGPGCQRVDPLMMRKTPMAIACSRSVSIVCIDMEMTNPNGGFSYSPSPINNRVTIFPAGAPIQMKT